jgi:hypothetical protein
MFPQKGAHCSQFCGNREKPHYHLWPNQLVTVSEVKRLQIYNGYYICNGHSPTDTGGTGARSVVTVVWRSWPLVKAKGNGFILVSECSPDLSQFYEYKVCCKGIDLESMSLTCSSIVPDIMPV